ncbi:MAG: TonB-dependent receptor [Candidatus Neomarinimicrobiota bacterium]
MSDKKTILIILLFFTVIWGQHLPRGYYSQRDSAWIHEMDSVFVEGLRSASLSTTTRITVAQERIEAMAYRDLNEVLVNEVPGVFGTEKGVMGYGVSGGSAGKLTLRGQGGDPTTGVLIVQNGKPEIMGLMGHPVPDAYAADVISEVEIIKGAASILYGTNALGGAINMKTRRVAVQGLETRLRLSGGSYGVRRMVFQHGGRLGQWDYFATYGSRSTNGHRPHSAFDSQAWHLRVGYEINPDFYLALVGKSVPFHMEDPGPEGGVTGLEYDITRSDLTLTARIDLTTIKLDYLIFHNLGEHEISDGFHSTDFCDGLILKHHFHLLKGNSTTVGLDYKNYGGKLIAVFKPGLVGEKFTVTETAGYLLSEQNLGRLTTSAGLRREIHSEFGAVIVPYLGASFRINERLMLTGSQGSGFRSPTIRELYLFPAPNTELKSEQSKTSELGLNYRPGRRLTVDLTTYRSSGHDRIETVGIWPNQELRNSGEFDYRGLDLALKLNPRRGLHLGLNAGWFGSDNPVVNQPEWQLSSTLGYHRQYFTIRGNLKQVVGVKYFDSGAYHRLPAYSVVNMGIEVTPIKTLALNLQVKNLLNSDYQSMVGFPLPGRSLEGGVFFDF